MREMLELGRYGQVVCSSLFEYRDGCEYLGFILCVSAWLLPNLGKDVGGLYFCMPDSIEGEVRGRYLSASYTVLYISTLRYSYFLFYRSLFFVVHCCWGLSILDGASGHSKIYL